MQRLPRLTLSVVLLVPALVFAHDHAAMSAMPAEGSFLSKYDFFSNFGNYLPKTHCLRLADGSPDWPWIIGLLVLNIVVIVGYLKIFSFWRACHLAEKPQDRNNKLMDLARIFLLCATCGYGFFILTLVWPAYRLLAVFMVALAIYTWRFAADLSSFRLSFSAKRLQRELNEHFAQRNQELERQVAERTRELEEVNEFKRIFLANMSHEIRTPMTAILGFTDLLDDPELSASQSQEHVATIRRNGQHLLRLINDVLDVSKIEAGRLAIERKPCDVKAVVDDVLRMLAPHAADRQVILSCTMDTMTSPTAYTDAMRLRQVLTNLVANALKFTNNGSVTVHIDAHESAGRPLMRFRVIDTGCGIAPEHLRRVFEPFEQVRHLRYSEVGGTGLGLTIARDLVRLLGGDIEATSLPGAGSTFTFTIDNSTSSYPAVPDATQGPDSVARAEQQSMLHGTRVLVAEDAADTQSLLRHLLTRWGAQMDFVANGQDAVDHALIASAKGKPFDAILMDVQMPQLDGLAATRALRAAGCEVPIIALTANALAGDRETCIGAGCSDYACKPIDPPQLLDALLRAMSCVSAT
ncbi:MAG: hybrid sensor histidine kinase/response regulator [Tepidisphaeraceae bacterium]